MARSKNKPSKQRRGNHSETEDNSHLDDQPNGDKLNGKSKHAQDANTEMAKEPRTAGGVDGFLTKVDELTEGDASTAIAQVRETYQSATTTIAQAMETVELAKRTYETVRLAAQDVFARAKQKPEPFIQAAVPAAVGVFMFLRQLQGGNSRTSRGGRASSRSAVIQ